MIRSFQISDIEDINRLGNEISKNFSKTNNLLDIYNDEYTKILVYEDGKKIVGFLMYTELEDTADILNIIVDKAYRNKKIASCLLDYMITDLKESVRLITLEVRQSNIAAIHLYEKFGFSIVNTRKNYYDTEDAYLMGRRFEK